MLGGSLNFEIFVRFAVPTNLITNLTYVEDFVKVLRTTKMGSCLRCLQPSTNVRYCTISINSSVTRHRGQKIRFDPRFRPRSMIQEISLSENPPRRPSASSRHMGWSFLIRLQPNKPNMVALVGYLVCIVLLAILFSSHHGEQPEMP